MFTKERTILKISIERLVTCMLCYTWRVMHNLC